MFFVAPAILLIAAGFAAQGSWQILPFAGGEVVLLGAAFMPAARHAGDQQQIERRYEILAVEEQDNVRVLPGTRGCGVENGRHLDARSGIDLAGELRLRPGHLVWKG